jgi:prophage DNA circulation protein
LKKSKDALAEKLQQVQNAEKNMSKERDIFNQEITMLRNSMKNLMAKKNEELLKIQFGNEEKMKQMSQDNSAAVEEMRGTWEREVRKIERLLKEKELKLLTLQSSHSQLTDRNAELTKTLETERSSLEEQLQNCIDNSAKYQRLWDNTNKLL